MAEPLKELLAYALALPDVSEGLACGELCGLSGEEIFQREATVDVWLTKSSSLAVDATVLADLKSRTEGNSQQYEARGDHRKAEGLSHRERPQH